MANNNIFLQNTRAGIPMPTPAITRTGYAPAIRQMAADYAQGAMDKVSGYMGRKGFLKSSFYPQLLEKAYQGGFERAMGDYTGQQKIYNQYARQLMALKMQEGAGQSDVPWWQRALTGAASGALAGMTIGGVPGSGKTSMNLAGASWWGVGIGAGIGALTSLLQ